MGGVLTPAQPAGRQGCCRHGCACPAARTCAVRAAVSSMLSSGASPACCPGVGPSRCGTGGAKPGGLPKSMAPSAWEDTEPALKEFKNINVRASRHPKLLSRPYEKCSWTIARAQRGSMQSRTCTRSSSLRCRVRASLLLGKSYRILVTHLGYPLAGSRVIGSSAAVAATAPWARPPRAQRPAYKCCSLRHM